MERTVEDIKRRYKTANSHKEQWRSIYEEAYEYALPMRNLYDGYNESGVPGQNKMKRVFDSTAIHSTARFANRIQSSLFPPQRAWCRLQPGNEIPEERKIEIQQVLDLYTEKMFAVMGQSGFDLAMGEFLLDLAVGTAVMLIQPGDEATPIRYTAVPTYHISFEEGPNGTVDAVYRKLSRPFAVVDREWPDADIPDELRKEFEEEANDELSRPENAGGVKVLEQGVEPKTVGFSPKDMTNEERLKRVRDTILAAEGVGGPLLGIYEFATLDNFREAKLQLWQNTLIPYQQMRCEVINGWLAELNDPAMSRLRVSYDYSGVRVLQEGNTEKLQAAVAMAQARVGLSFNNAAALLGMDDIDQDLGSDIILEPQEAPDLDGEDDENEDPKDSEKSAAVLKSVATSTPEPELSELRSYYKTLEKRLMIPADGRLKQVLMKFLRSFELAQIRKIGRVAKNGPDPEDIAKGYVVKDARDITPEIIEKILLLAAESWKLKLSKAAKSTLADIYKGALFQAASELGVSALPLADPLVVEALAQQLFQLSGVVDTLREQIKAKMVEVFAQGATIGDLQQSIQGLVPELKAGVKDVLKARASRALVIARNETGNAINRARWEQMKEAGVTHIQWITSADDAVRDSHRDIDGDIVALGVPFDNGLKYPHDPAGPLDEVIQCRCTIRKAKKQEAAA